MELIAYLKKHITMTNKYESILTLIESKIDEFTEIEKTISDYFMNLTADEDISSKAVSQRLFVSESALTRFAKKLGFSGYREFSYQFKNSKEKAFNDIKGFRYTVFDTYQEILSKSYYLFDDRKLNKVVNAILRKKRIFVYGMGSSGLLGQEFVERISRMGLDAECIKDSHYLILNHARVTSDSIVIGISYSGKTTEVIDALIRAKKKKAYTVIMTSVDLEEFNKEFDQVLLMALKKNLDFSNIISPQFPGLILTDILYMKILEKKSETANIFKKTTKDLLKKTRGEQ